MLVPTVDTNILSVAFRDRSLCARSGTCVGICPTGAIQIGDDQYPILDPEKCTSCGKCGRACPGGEVSYQKLTQSTFGDIPAADSFDGHVEKTFLAYAEDPTMRTGGAGGGVVTALLHDLLKHGDVDGCIVTRMRAAKPWLGEPFIARNETDLLLSQGSRYSVIPLNAIFREIRSSVGRYAIAALPCQVHGYRKAIEEDPVLRERIVVVIGLFCGGALETYVVEELLQTKGIGLGDIQDFQFRGGSWPGKMRAVMHNSEIRNLHHSNYKDGAYNYFTGMYLPKRCQTCIDGSCEFSDLSVSDVWTRTGSGDYKFTAHSRVLCRTALGIAVTTRAAQRGTLNIRDVTGDTDYQTHRLRTRRKGLNAPLRVARWARNGIQVPLYDRPTPEATVKEQWTEYLVSSCLWVSQFHAIRYPLIKFLTSDYAKSLIRLRMWRKKRKYQHSAISGLHPN